MEVEIRENTDSGDCDAVSANGGGWAMLAAVFTRNLHQGNPKCSRVIDGSQRARNTLVQPAPPRRS